MRAQDGQRRARGLLGALVVGLVVSLLPGLAQAHFDVPGYNGAQLDVPDEEILFAFSPRPIPVTGRNFVPNDRALIFQCPVGATDLLNKCLAIGAAATDASGGFSTQVVINNSFASPSGATTTCKGYSGFTTQCSVAAATYDTFLQEPTSMADHYLCFQGIGVFCSINRDGSPTTTTTTAPPQGPEWEPAAPMNVARHRLATAVGNDGRIYALGGTENEDDAEALTAAEVFDPCGNKAWSSLPPMPTARTRLAAATGPDGRIYAIGGRDSLFGTPLATVDAYDPATNTWSAVARLALPRSELAAATGSDGRIYAIGGTVAGGTQVSLVEAYDTVTDTWAAVTPMSAPRSDHGAAVGPDGRIYAIGGRGAAFQVPFPRVESYSPGEAGTPGTWTPKTSAQGLPPEMAVATGPDGLIYGTGGTASANTESLRSVLVYNTATDTWTASPEAMTTRRAAHGAATGRDGRIYAIGGNDEDFGGAGEVPLRSTESLEVGPNSCPPPSPPPADFDGDGDTDISVFRPSTGTWFAKDGATSAWGAQGDIPVPGDYDGDRKADVAIFRPATGLWAIDGSAGADTFVTYGIATDVPVPADYDGDGRTDIAVYRPEYATWWVHRSSDGTDTARTFGLPTDVAVPGDYDGDGSADLGIFRDGTWFVQPASGGAYTATTYGIPGDVSVPGDYDSDRRTDMAVFRPSDGTWALHHSSDGADEIFGFGIPGDVPVPGDYDGDWRWDPAVFRPSTGEWFIETGQSASWGTATDVPLPLPTAIRNSLP